MKNPMTYRNIRRGIELGFVERQPLIYDGTEPVAIDAQAGKGKLSRFLGVNLVSPRTAHFTKIITDPKDAELAWVSWKTLERQGYKVLFINVGRLYGHPHVVQRQDTGAHSICAGLVSMKWSWDFQGSWNAPLNRDPSAK